MIRIPPFLHTELRVVARQGRYFWIRSGYILVLFALFGMSWAQSSRWADPRLDYARLASIGAGIFWHVAELQVCLVLAVGPILSAGLICTEVRRRTLGLLFLTRLGAAGIVLGKWLACLAYLVLIILSSLPVLLITQLLGGVTGQQISVCLVACLAGALLSTAVGLLMSSCARDFHTALIAAYAVLFGIGFLPLLYVKAYWVSDQLVATWSPVNPLLLLQHAANSGSRGGVLTRAFACLVVHASVTALVLVGVGLRLQVLARRTPGPGWVQRISAGLDRLAGVRWRWNRVLVSSARPAVISVLRLESLTGFTGTARNLVRIGLLLYVLLCLTYLGFAGAIMSSPEAHLAFLYLLFAIILGICGVVAGTAVTRDRERGTLEPLLATPYLGREIVGGKALAALRLLAPVVALPLVHAVVMVVEGFYPPHIAVQMAGLTVCSAALVFGAGILASTLARTTTVATLATLAALVLVVAVPLVVYDDAFGRQAPPSLDDWRQWELGGCLERSAYLVSPLAQTRLLVQECGDYWILRPRSDLILRAVADLLLLLAGLACYAAAVRLFDRATGRLPVAERGAAAGGEGGRR